MRIADMPKRIHPYFLYCRFAWTILLCVVGGDIVGVEGQIVSSFQKTRHGKASLVQSSKKPYSGRGGEGGGGGTPKEKEKGEFGGW